MRRFRKWHDNIYNGCKKVNRYNSVKFKREYSKWGNFIKVIDKAKKSCENSNNTIFEHFADIGKTIKLPKNAERTIDDMKLTRYACYLVAQNGDSRKKAIALAQTYFAVQTRKLEITRQEYKNLSEDEKLYTRQNVKDKNKYSEIYYKYVNNLKSWKDMF